MSFDLPTIAISVSQGIIKYSGLEKESYYKCFAKLIDHLTSQGKQVILIAHVLENNPSNNDVIACLEVIKNVKNKSLVRIISGEPSAIELKGLIGQCEALIGTRTHATIASLSQRIPTVSIAYSRKAYGIMRDIYGESLGNSLTIDAKKITPQNLINAYEEAISHPIEKNRIAEIKKLSMNNFSIAKEIANQ
jgi:polysaccharide pyruvyl transferase WcaK-like protein